MSHVECAPRVLLTLEKNAPCALLRLEKRWDRQTDGQTPNHNITLMARRGQRNVYIVCHKLLANRHVDSVGKCFSYNVEVPNVRADCRTANENPLDCWSGKGVLFLKLSRTALKDRKVKLIFITKKLQYRHGLYLLLVA